MSAELDSVDLSASVALSSGLSASAELNSDLSASAALSSGQQHRKYRTINHGIQQSLMITAASGLPSEGEDSSRIRDK